MYFCIVVPNLNYGQFLDACLASIEGQVGVDVGVLIIDGGSTDNSRAIAEEYCQRNNWTFLEKNGSRSGRIDRLWPGQGAMARRTG